MARWKEEVEMSSIESNFDMILGSPCRLGGYFYPGFVIALGPMDSIRNYCINIIWIKNKSLVVNMKL